MKKNFLFIMLLSICSLHTTQLLPQEGSSSKEGSSSTEGSSSIEIPMGINKEVKHLEKSIKKNITKATDSVEEIGEKFFSWKNVKNLLSLENIVFANIPFIYVLLLAFLIGIATSFTPCIYPMIPITIGILQSQASKSVGRNFLLSTAYVTGMATVYAILGYFAATTSFILGEWLSNPFFAFLLILLFLYLAFSMFGFYEIYMPKFLQRGTNMKVGGSVLYSFLFGAVSGTAASPCLTPALALLLGYVAKRGNPVIGFLTLFVFALGLGVLLITVGTFSNTITNLPRAGTWMNEIKKFFGFLLIGVALYFGEQFIPPVLATALYTALVIGTIGYYGFVIAKKFKTPKQMGS